MNRLDEADAMLGTVLDKSGHIWLAHSRSQVKLAKGDLSLALALVDEAIAGAVGAERKYRSSFLLQRAKVRLAMGDDPTADIAEGRRETSNAGLHEGFDDVELRHANRDP